MNADKDQAVKMLEDLEEVVRAFARLPTGGNVSPTMYADAAKAQIAASNFVCAYNVAIADMAKRLEAAERDAAEIQATLPGVYYMDPPDGGSVTVAEQFRRMARDAERYRWLREHEWNYPIVTVFQTGDHSSLGVEELDAAIDAAMQEAVR